MSLNSINGLRTYCLALLVALLCVARPVPAQMSFGAQAGSDQTTVVDESAVLANARDAFRVATGDRIVSTRLDDDAATQAQQLLRRLSREFERELRLELSDLKGDGVLEAAEVTEAFGELRSNYLDRLDLAIDALARGHAPPPHPADYQTRLGHARAMLDYTLFERNDVSDWLALLAALIGGLLCAWLASLALRTVGSRLRTAGRYRTAELADALIAPVYLAAIAIALHTGFNWLWVPGIAGELLNRFVDVGLMAAIFWFAWNACETVARGVAWLLQKTYGQNMDRHVVLVVSRALRIVLLIAFLLVLVNGILDSNLAGLIAGLGIIGVALSFILRGTIENIGASFTIFGDKPFRVGDLIVFDEHWGRIEDIGFRSTRFRTLSGHLFTIPNSQIVENPIHNVGARPSIRRRFRLGLTYSTPPEKVEEAIAILRELLDDHRGQPKDQPAHVAFEAYDESQLTLLVQYYFEPASYWQALEFDTEINLAILHRFREAGIDLAFPSRSVYLHAGDDDFSLSARDEAADDERLVAPAGTGPADEDDAADAEDREDSPQEAA